MATYDKERLELACPSGRKPLNPTFYEVLGEPEIKCPKCASGYRFDSSAKSPLKTALGNVEKAQEDVGKAYDDLMKRAEVFLKK
jgi:hypothetical protein